MCKPFETWLIQPPTNKKGCRTRRGMLLPILVLSAGCCRRRCTLKCDGLIGHEPYLVPSGLVELLPKRHVAVGRALHCTARARARARLGYPAPIPRFPEIQKIKQQESAPQTCINQRPEGPVVGNCRYTTAKLLSHGNARSQ
jgi:hypothetical protein